MAIVQDLIMEMDRAPLTYDEMAERLSISRRTAINAACEIAAMPGVTLIIASDGPSKRIGIDPGGEHD